jgi:hypothetical protein
MKDYYLKIVAISEAAVVGAGFGVALIGAMEIATAIAAQQWLTEAKHYTDYAPLVGGAVGVITRGSRIARRRRWAAAEITGMSEHVEGTSQYAKLDEIIGVDGKAKPAHKPSADVIPLSTPANVSL